MTRALSVVVHIVYFGVVVASLFPASLLMMYSSFNSEGPNYLDITRKQLDTDAFNAFLAALAFSVLYALASGALALRISRGTRYRTLYAASIAGISLAVLTWASFETKKNYYEFNKPLTERLHIQAQPPSQ